MNESKQNCKVIKNRDRKPRPKPKTLRDEIAEIRGDVMQSLKRLDALLKSEALENERVSG